jgi:hypothetical protein
MSTSFQFLHSIAIPSMLRSERLLVQPKAFGAFPAVLAAALNCFHLEDYIFHEYLKQGTPMLKLSTWRESFWSAHIELAILHDVANIYKHREISRPNRLVTAINQISFGPAFVRYRDDQGSYFKMIRRVRIDLNDGRSVDLSRVVRVALDLSIARLAQFENAAAKIIVLPRRLYCERNENFLTDYSFIALAGASLNFRNQMVDYDELTNSTIDSNMSDEPPVQVNGQVNIEVLESEEYFSRLANEE